MNTYEQREALRELLTKWQANRERWIEVNGNDSGFAEWFEKQVTR